MIHFKKKSLGTYNKLKPCKLGPFSILASSNDDTYVIALPVELSISLVSNILVYIYIYILSV